MNTAMRKVIFFSIFFLTISFFAEGETIEEKFKNQKKLIYEVSFNGIPSGVVEWEYLGRGEVKGEKVDILSVSSDTKIVKILNLLSTEKVFLNSKTHLPLKVERDVIFFGKKELIEEFYNQDEGSVKIVKSNARVKEEVIYQKKPIHNILALLYFFPQNIQLKKGKWMLFNLPTQKIKIKFIQERVLSLGGDKKEDTYFLIGRGAKRFNLWINKKSRLPLRLEFILPVGRVIITKKVEDDSFHSSY